jgi:hypothetical protein
VGEVEIRHRVDVAVRRVVAIVAEPQRPEHIEEAEEKVPQPRAQIQHIRRADDEHAAGRKTRLISRSANR